MIFKIKAPSPGETIKEIEISSWLVKNGDYVIKDQIIGEIETDKATLEITAIESGFVKLNCKKGEIIPIGKTICYINNSNKLKNYNYNKEINSDLNLNKYKNTNILLKPLDEKSCKSANKLNLKRDIKISKLSKIRCRISEKLVRAKNETAMLTTFNEVDMSEINKIRNNFKEIFNKIHGVKLGLMSFFTKSCVKSLNLYPNINSMIDGENKINFKYCDIGIAISSPKGLIVPILKNAELLSFSEIEKKINFFYKKIKIGKISIEELSGGTFTITNGGVFGSMLSTPIINSPQSAILGMHNIIKRTVVIKNKIEIRPIMYLALSYDHRIIDGNDSISFLMSIKKFIENPVKYIMNNNIEKSLDL